MVKISKYIDRRNIVFLDVETREEAIKKLVDVFEANHRLKDKEAFYEAVCEREKIVSTGIGMGVAIPHAKLSSYNDFFIGIGILKKGVNWDAIDDAPVRLVFLIGGPDDKQTEYLQILSGLTLAVKDEERRKKIISLEYVDEILRLFREF
jgi:nitrogen PTS system EIIA component